MEQGQSPPIISYFSVIRDPRIEQNKLCPLPEVAVITILVVIAMAQGRKTVRGHFKRPKTGKADVILNRFFKLCPLYFPCSQIFEDSISLRRSFFCE
jgi:hypothetical protein